MFKVCALLVACSLASLGCESKNAAATTTTPVATGTETPKTPQPPMTTTPVKAETEANANGKWVTIKGKVVWDKAKGAAPQQTAIKPTKDEEVCAKDKNFKTEDWVVNPKNGGIENVVVWLAPEPTDEQMKALQTKRGMKFPSFKAADINPKLAKPAKDTVEIDQPCCRFIPHVIAARAGQSMVIKNSAPIPHNAKWVSRENGEINPLIPAGGEYKLEKPLVAEKFPIQVNCSIHPWMGAWVRVFDHPYYAVTDKDGNFEIKDAPVLKGKLRLFVWQESAGMLGGAAGRFGKTIDVKPGTVDLGEIKFASGK